MKARPIQVLVVDDSAVVRQVITEILAQDSGIVVLAAVADPLFAMARMRIGWPDVIVLDVEMPRMDGITFLRKIMAQRPTPVVICSTLTSKGAATTMQALAAGAVTVVEKPKVGARRHLLEGAASLVQAVKVAALANMRNLRPIPYASAGQALAASLDTGASAPLIESSEIVVAIGTSTGGTQALEQVLSALSCMTAGIVVVQHMPEKFTAAFAERLNGICRVEVKEASDHDRVLPGRVLIAPGGRHMKVARNGAQYLVRVGDGPMVHHHRPSVDVLFRSVAASAGRNAVGIIMTGMGADGAGGLKAMRDAGAHTIAQDEATSVVFGMPKEAIKIDAVDSVLPLQEIWRAIPLSR